MSELDKIGNIITVVEEYWRQQEQSRQAQIQVD
jgi:hypothetical protein